MSEQIIDKQVALYFESGISLKKIAESGQCFRWKEIGAGIYLVPASQECAIITQISEKEIALTKERGTFDFWDSYLAGGNEETYDLTLKQTSDATLADGSPDEHLRKAASAALGMRILHQDLWEVMVSFIISQNNNIPRIKRGIETLCKEYGDRKFFCGYEYYTFPTPTQLRNADFAKCNLGYRTKYLQSLVSNVLSGAIDLNVFGESETEAARNCLKSKFFYEDETVVQFHPAKSEYVNNMPNCLHLWRPTSEKLPTPPAIFVGIKKGMSREEIKKEVEKWV